MALGDTLQTIEDSNRLPQMAATWGIPQKNIKHYGQILYVNGTVAIAEFKSLDGDWLATDDFFEHMSENCGTEGIYIFNGYYIFKGNKYVLKGDISKLSLKKMAEHDRIISLF